MFQEEFNGSNPTNNRDIFNLVLFLPHDPQDVVDPVIISCSVAVNSFTPFFVLFFGTPLSRKCNVTTVCFVSGTSDYCDILNQVMLNPITNLNVRLLG